MHSKFLCYLCILGYQLHLFQTFLHSGLNKAWLVVLNNIALCDPTFFPKKNGFLCRRPITSDSVKTLLLPVITFPLPLQLLIFQSLKVNAINIPQIIFNVSGLYYLFLNSDTRLINPASFFILFLLFLDLYDYVLRVLSTDGWIGK